jgi:hypothetical protein
MDNGKMRPELSPRNPFRPLHWRWERAGEAIKERSLSRNNDGVWVRRAYRFRRHLQTSQGEAALAILADEMPDLYWAHQLYVKKTSAGDTASQEGHLTGEIEARLLADQSHAAIADRFGIEAGTITAYEAIFFNVSDRLKHKSYIVHNAIGGRVHHGAQERDVVVLWKLFGYFYGPAMLDALCEMVVNPTRPEPGAGLLPTMVDATHDTITRRALLAAQTMKLNGFNEVDLITAFLKISEQGRGSGTGNTSGGTATYTENVHAMLTSMRQYFAVGAPKTGSEQAAIEASYEEQGIELHAHELTQLADGKLPPPSPDMVVKFPPLPPSAQRALPTELEPD